MGHLMIFGCTVYIYVQVEKRTKLDPSGEKGVLIGCCEESKAYKVFTPP